MTTTTNTAHVGHAMRAALRILVESGPQSSALVLAQKVGPHGSHRYGYATVGRLVGARLAVIDPTHPAASRRGQGAVVATPAGLAFPLG